MNFHAQIKNICRRAGQKLSALLRISSYLDQGKQKFKIQIDAKI